MLYNETASLNYDLSSTAWRQVEKTSHSKLPGFAQGGARFFLKLILSVKYIRYPRSNADVLFLIGSQNNFKSLCPVLAATKNAGFIGYNSQVNYKCHIPEFYFYLHALLFLPKFLLAYFACPDRYVKWTMRRRLDRYLLAFSSTAQWARILSRTSCRVLVISNDHVVWARSALKAAQSLGIKTIFIPHAPTGQHPPKLEFDYAFFDGKAQYHTYLKEGTGRTKCFITGAIRYENLVLLSEEKGDGILLCFNPIDSNEFIKKSLLRLHAESNKKPIYVRPHPSDGRRLAWIESLCSEFGFEFCSPRAPILSQLQKVDMVIAGVSGVHVDAIMAGRTAVTIEEWYSGDYYGLKKMGLLRVVSGWSDLQFVGTSDPLPARSESNIKELNWHKSNAHIVPSHAAAQLLNRIVSGPTINRELSVSCPEVDFYFDRADQAYFSHGTGSHEKPI